MKPTYDPGPCPTCGGTDVETDWIYVSPNQWDYPPDPNDPDPNPDHWMPGSSRCLNPDCPSRFPECAFISQTHDPASRPEAS
jgi:hypothetical protein